MISGKRWRFDVTGTGCHSHFQLLSLTILQHQQIDIGLRENECKGHNNKGENENNLLVTSMEIG